MEDVIVDDGYFFVDGNLNHYPYIEDDDVNKVAREQYHKWLKDEPIDEEKDDGYYI